MLCRSTASSLGSRCCSKATFQHSKARIQSFKTARIIHTPSAMKIEPTTAHVQVHLGDDIIADTKNAKMLFEGSTPVYYIPPEDVRTDILSPGSNTSSCPFKGKASYYDAPGKPSIAWYYPQPKPGVESIKDHLAFYNSRVDKATVDGVVTKISPW